MKKSSAISIVIAIVALTGCHSGNNDNSAVENTTDTTSSQIATPSKDSVIKDTVMKDSVGKQKKSAGPG